MSQMDDGASTSNNTSSCVGLAEESQLHSATMLQPRRYQLEFFEKAKNENVIVYLETGSGKTQIAVLLIEEFGMRLSKPSKNVCVFLVPTVTLVNQQAEVIESQLTLKVGRYHGLANHSNKTHVQWEKELEEHEVLVMTPDILLRCLHHCFIKMEWIELLVFDECHHTQNDHPYAKIMRQFYKKDEVKRPRIFGMTASPIKGKGGSSKVLVAEQIQSLEGLLDAKVHTVNQRSELDMYVALPLVRIEYYENNAFVDCWLKDKLKECMMKHVRLISNDDHTQNMENDKDESRKKVCKIYSDLMCSLTETGCWGTKQVARMLLNDHITTLNEDGDQDENDIAKSFLNDALLILESHVQDDINVITETPLYTEKVQTLLNILSSYRNEQNIRAIIFVRRIVTARILTRIINDVHILKFWQCELLVGAHSGLKEMSRGKMTRVLEKFRSGMVNLLVATNVAEEGLDIQMCSLVVRFDLPTGVCSFIQSRGRARMKQSSYIFLVERDNMKDELFVSRLRDGEIIMKSEVKDRTIFFEQLEYEEENNYCVKETGATITSGCSVSLLNEYCSKLPKDDLFSPHPEFSFVSGPEGISCHINLPPSSPVRLVVGPASSSTINAKRSASLEACIQLHLKGGLDNYLLPRNNDLDLDDTMNTASDSKDHNGEELHEMLVPIALQSSWSMSETSVNLNAYLVNFVPLPPDREYTQFALFVGSSLPKEAETMCVELHLARSRTVRTELSPAGCIQLDKIQLTNALKFQEVFLKIMLEPKFFFETFVQLGGGQFSGGRRSSYLLLPAEVDGNRNICIDWTVIKQCLSSPVFSFASNSQVSKTEKAIHCKSHDYLLLNNGPFPIKEVHNALVMTPHYGNNFYYVAGIYDHLNAKSTFKQKGCSYEVYYKKKYNITLHRPEQPLLKVKGAFVLHNLLHLRSQKNSKTQECQELEEEFLELPPELCCIKVFSFSSHLARSVTLLPSLMHRLESLLLAIELRQKLASEFPEGGEVKPMRVLEAITTERCSEGFSLERLEVLGDSFLKYAVSSCIFINYDKANEGQLSSKRTSLIRNATLYKKGKAKGFQGFIQDELFDPKQFSALGHHCHTICNSDTMFEIHSLKEANGKKKPNIYVKCNRRHRWISMKTIADVVEALIGAYLIDSGFKAALAFINWIGIDVKMDQVLIKKLCFCYKDVPSLKYDISIDNLQRLIGYNFKYKGLLVEAFIHPSYNDPSAGSYQRLEFLGDAALEYIITSYFYSVYPKLDPGSLTDMRSMTVNNEAFAAVAINHSLYTYIIHNSSRLLPTVTRYAESVKASKKDAFEAKCPKVLGDIVESLAGAILVDTGFNIELLWRLMLELLDPIETPETLYIQPDRELTELCSYHRLELEYAEEKIGRVYHISAKVSGKDFKGNCLSVVGKGANMNSKVATKNAAKDALAQLKAEHGFDHQNKRLEQLNGASDKMCPTLIGVDRGATFIWTDKTSSSLLVDQETASNRPSVSTSLDRDMENASSNNNVSAQQSSIPTNESSNNSGAQNLSTSITESLDNVAQHSISINECTDNSGTQCSSTVAMELPPRTAVSEDSGARTSTVQPASTSTDVIQYNKTSDTGIINNECTDNSGTQCSSTVAMELPPRTAVSEDSGARTSTVQPASTSTDVIQYNKTSDTVQYEGCARSFLYEFCMKHGFRGPHWECIAEEGPSHFKSFKYKVVVELGEKALECEGEAKPNKKLAMESAAHLARWWLGEHGFSPS